MAGEFIAGSIVSKLLLDTKKWSSSVTKINKDQSKMMKDAQKTSAAFKKVGLGMTVAGAAIVAGMGKAVGVFGDFDQAMTESISIMGDVSDEMRRKMEDAALQMSTESTFAADELGKSYFFLASAGLDAEQSIGALPVVMKFAQAGAFDLSSATDLLTDAQSALGLSSKEAAENQENMTRVSDVLVKANTLANASVSQFSEALTNKAGAAMRAYEIDLEAGVAVLAAFADQGTKGKDAGTQFSIVLRELQKAALQNKKAFESAGVAVFDASGNLNNMGTIVEQLENRLGPMSAEQKKAEMTMLGFSEKSQMALLTLIGTSDKIKDYEKNLRSAGGITAEVAAKQLTSFNNQMTIAKNKVSTAAIAIGEQLAPIVVDVATKISNVVKQVADWARANPALFGTITKVVAAAGGLMMVLGPIVMILPKLIMNIRLLKTTMPGATGAFAKFGAVATAAFIGWEIGKRIGEIKILGKSINDHLVGAFESLTDKIVGLGEEQEKTTGAMAAQEKRSKMLAEASELAGTEITNIHDALSILNDRATKSERIITTVAEAEEDAKDEAAGLNEELINIGTTIQSLESPLSQYAQSQLDVAKAFATGEIGMGQYVKRMADLREERKKNLELFSEEEFAIDDAIEGVDSYIEEWESVPPALGSVLQQAGIEVFDLNSEIVTDTGETATEVKNKWTDATDGMVTDWSQALGEFIRSGDLFKGDFKGIMDTTVDIFSDSLGQMLSMFLNDFVKGILGGASEAASGILSSLGSALGGGGGGAGGIAGGISSVTSALGGLANPVSMIAQGITAVASVAQLLQGPGGPSSTDSWHFKQIWEEQKQLTDYTMAEIGGSSGWLARIHDKTNAVVLKNEYQMQQNRKMISSLKNIAESTAATAQNTRGILKRTGSAQTGALHMRPGLFAVGEEAPRIPEITAPIPDLMRMIGGGPRPQIFLTVGNRTEEIDMNEGVKNIMIEATPELTRQGRMKVNVNALVEER